MQLSYAFVLAGALCALWEALLGRDIWEREKQDTIAERVGNAWEFRRLAVVAAVLVLVGVALEVLGY